MILALTRAAGPWHTAPMTLPAANAVSTTRCISLLNGPSHAMPCPPACTWVTRACQSKCGEIAGKVGEAGMLSSTSDSAPACNDMVGVHLATCSRPPGGCTIEGIAVVTDCKVIAG